MAGSSQRQNTLTPFDNRVCGPSHHNEMNVTFVQKWNKNPLRTAKGLLLLTYLQRNRQRIALGAHYHSPFATGLRTALHARDLRDIAQT